MTEESESDLDITDISDESATLPTLALSSTTSDQRDQQEQHPYTRHPSSNSFNQPEVSVGEVNEDYYEFETPDESSSAPILVPVLVPGSSSRQLNPVLSINENDNDQSNAQEKDARFPPSAQSPEEIVMENHLVLEAVFKKLAPATLKQIRLVNKKWNEIALNTLIQLKCLRIRLYSSRKSVLGILSPAKPYELTMSQLQDFNDYYSHPSRKFPITGVAMEVGVVPFPDSDSSNGNEEQLLRFFTLYGSYIKKLTITRGHGCVFTKHPVSKLRDLLFKHFPNVEYLQIEDLNLTRSSTPLPNMLPLPNNNFPPGLFNVQQWIPNPNLGYLIYGGRVPANVGPVPVPVPVPVPEAESVSSEDEEVDDAEFEENIMELPANLEGMAAGGVVAHNANHALQLHQLVLAAAAAAAADAGDIRRFDFDQPNQCTGSGSGSRSYQLPSLKTLKFVPINNYRSVLVDLLNSAPNMEQLVNFQIQSVDVIEETRKIHIVKDFIHFPSFHFPNLFRFAALGPKLVNLKVCSVSPTFGGNQLEDFVALRKILISSKDSLKSLHCYPFHLLTPHEEEEPMPLFSNLKLLSLFYPSESVSTPNAPIFPHGLDLTGVFPNVETVVLDMKDWNVESLRYYFPCDNFDVNDASFEEGDIDDIDLVVHVQVQPWTSVTHLVLRPCSIDKVGLRALGMKFPNVKRFTGESVHHLFETDDSVWNLPWDKLESLELHGFILQGGFFNMSMDSFFTGIPNAKLQNLQQLRMSLVEGDVLEEEPDWPRLKTRKSIDDFQHLRQLKIVFDHKGNSGWKLPPDFKTNPRPDITRLSWDYGFKLIPHLSKPVFAFDAKECDPQDVKILLEPLLPFINLGDEPQRRIRRPREM